ncbi:MAG: peptide-methionine (S)-S-oxide reductase MsrA [Myxococcales bacterium]|nr:peptide-methionine (S)-S-oxide reductase MsrA [Myxococcales bacterium]
MPTRAPSSSLSLLSATGLLAAAALLVACSPTRGSSADLAAAAPPDAAPSEAAPQGEPTTRAEPGHEEGLAYFAGGCFWGVEHFMEQLDGVQSVESGYMGGHVDNPSYEQVASQTSGHVETVRVRYDPSRVSYEQIARRFFEIHDPTQANGQGPDIGPEYLSVVFYTSPAQQQTSEALIATLEARGYDVVTELRPATRFWEAEAFHQDYYERKGSKPYCHALVRRFDD